MKKILTVLIVVAAIAGGVAYWLFLGDNIPATDTRPSVNIPTGSQLGDVFRILEQRRVVKDIKSFEMAAKIKGYKVVKPGHYVFNKSMSNREIINMLQSGKQTPVKLVIYNIRTKEEFAGLVGRTLEIDSVIFLSRLNDPDFCAGYNLDTNNILNLFITDNYDLKWNTSITDFSNKMKGYYEAFWQGPRRDKAKEMGFNPAQITTLASIVEKECVFDKELPVVAGVFLNRLKVDMPLQSDPTLKFAARDFNAHRVTNHHKDIVSPYNTYQNKGLPPGPICMPRKKSIDAVLNAEQNDYIYFCANPDMSDYHVFSRTLAEQNKIAVEYRKKLNELKIK